MAALKLILAAAFAAMTLAGCAGTPTSRSTGQQIDDASITARVKTALIEAPDVKARQINVETYNGVVQLSGFVDSDEMAARAVSQAKRVPGVRSVKNDIRVKPSS
jgi:hyperosmotically inducible periplasmic protein